MKFKVTKTFNNVALVGDIGISQSDIVFFFYLSLALAKGGGGKMHLCDAF